VKSAAGTSVIITGGGSGIGEATARYLTAAGARVTIIGRRAAKIAAVVESLGAACCGVVGDVTDADDRKRLIAQAAEHGGGIDTLINNAGNMSRNPIGGWTADELADVFASNVSSGMLLTQDALEHLAVSRGSVVFVSSVYTVRAYPGAAPYAATKGAIETLVRVLAAELGPRQIRVNAVRPGAVLTEINQRAGVFTDEQAAQRLQRMANHHVLGRIGTGEEVATAINFAAYAPWVTGAVIDVDGGLGLGITV
jgi:NAD(P)-dependent dehydrogenase (short-subunit alcohol dehydrogenase family)